MRGFFTLCRYIGACGSSAVSCRDVAGVVPLAGGSAGCGGMLPGKGCPPFHFEPCFFCPIVSLDDSLLLLLVEVLICFFSDLCVVVWSLYDCPSGMKSALRCVLWTLTRKPWLLNVHRSLLFRRISMPVGVSVTGAILAVVPSVVWLTSSLMLTGSVTSVTGKK